MVSLNRPPKWCVPVYRTGNAMSVTDTYTTGLSRDTQDRVLVSSTAPEPAGPSALAFASAAMIVRRTTRKN
jgi:hypothetical protein